MKKNVLFYVFALLLLPLAVSASIIKVNIDGINYKLDTSNNTAEVIKWSNLSNKYTGDVVIPSTVTDYGIEYSVTGIGNNVFDSCTELTSVTFPHTITSIGYEVFRDCTGLVSIVIEKGCQKYDSRENCNAIIETAGNKIIYGCNGTTIPSSVTAIGKHAFLGCNGPISVIIPDDGVMSIENEAFKKCNGITSVYIGKEVINIEYDAFCDCSNLKKAEINNNALVSKSYEGVSSINNFFGGQVQEFILGEDVTSIGNSAFYGTSHMTSFHMSDNVTTIGEQAFLGCSQLSSIRLSESLISIGEYAFQNCQSLTSIIIPESMRTIGLWAFGWCNNLERVVVYSNEIVSRGNNEQYYSLSSCFGKQVKKYVLGEKVTGIGSFAFFDSNELTSTNIPSDVTSVGDSAFYSCQVIADVFCYAEQVPETGKDVFLLSNYTNATLHVPAASIEDYKNAEQWKDFGNIVALTDDDPKPTGIEVSTAMQPPTIIERYTIDGKHITTPQRGLNIVKMSDGTTKKIIVK